MFEELLEADEDDIGLTIREMESHELAVLLEQLDVARDYAHNEAGFRQSYGGNYYEIDPDLAVAFDEYVDETDANVA